MAACRAAPCRYRGYNGTITETASKGAARTYVCSGKLEVLGNNAVEVTELPVRKWTQDYKEFLESLVKPEEKVCAVGAATSE